MLFRTLQRKEIQLLWSIDRREIVENIYYVENNKLVLKQEYFDMKGWPPGEDEIYTPLLQDCYDWGGYFIGVFDNQDMIGVMILNNKFMGKDNNQVQLKFLHVSRDYRKKGFGKLLFKIAVQKAIEIGADKLYISSTPSENTVNFYLHLNCRLTEDVDPELYKLEPEDIHLEYIIPKLRSEHEAGVFRNSKIL